MYGSQNATLVWSSGVRWGGVVVELHRIAQVDASEFYVHEHTVVLHRGDATSMEIEAPGEDRRHTVQPGEVSLFRAGAPRRIRFGSSEQLMLTLTPEFTVHAVAAANGGSPPELVDRYALNDPQIVHIATALEAEAAAGYPSGRVYGESMGIALTGHLITHHSSRARPVEHKGGMSPCALRRVLRYIDDHLAEDIRLHALGRGCGLESPSIRAQFQTGDGVAAASVRHPSPDRNGKAAAPRYRYDDGDNDVCVGIWRPQPLRTSIPPRNGSHTHALSRAVSLMTNRRGELQIPNKVARTG